MALRFSCACFNREDLSGPLSLNYLLECQCSSVLERGKLSRIFVGILLISRGFGGGPIQLFMLQSQRFIWAIFVELSSVVPVQFSAQQGKINADFIFLFSFRGFGGAPTQVFMLQSRRCSWANFFESSFVLPVVFSAAG